jgi:methylated-DNA-protein-cysteine methyltransferase related protein
MKAVSPFFARIQKDVVCIVASIPRGSLVTFQAVGAHLDVAPRHVAYILAMQDHALLGATPWHRVVPADGKLRTPKSQGGVQQRELLQTEGVVIAADGTIAGFERIAREVATLGHGVSRQLRPANAPSAATRRRPKRSD